MTTEKIEQAGPGPDSDLKVETHRHASVRAGRLRALPSVDRVVWHPAMAEGRAQVPQSIVTAAARAEVEAARKAVLAGEETTPDVDEIVARAMRRAWLMTSPSLRPVINATGVIIHTNLGRAPLSRAATEA